MTVWTDRGNANRAIAAKRSGMSLSLRELADYTGIDEGRIRNYFHDNLIKVENTFLYQRHGNKVELNEIKKSFQILMMFMVLNIDEFISYNKERDVFVEYLLRHLEHDGLPEFNIDYKIVRIDSAKFLNWMVEYAAANMGPSGMIDGIDVFPVKRAGVPGGRIVKLKDLGRFSGYSVSMLEAYVKDGLPVYKQGRPGVPSKYDTAVFVAWKIERARAEKRNSSPEMVENEDGTVSFVDDNRAGARNIDVTKARAGAYGRLSKEQRTASGLSGLNTRSGKDETKEGGDPISEAPDGSAVKMLDYYQNKYGNAPSEVTVGYSGDVPDEEDTEEKDGVNGPENADGSPVTLNENRLKLRRMAAQARTAELDLQIKIGKLCEIDKAVTLFNNIIANCRQRLLALPSKAAPQVALISNPNSVQDILEKLIYEALDELSKLDPTDFCGEKITAGMESPTKAKGQ